MDLLEKEWYIQAPWGRIAIIAWGDCYDPPVLLVHGSSDSAVSFRPLVSQLPKKYYYIGMDLPGNGRSDNFPPGLMVSVYDLIYSVHAVVKHFRWKNFVYIGHSFGTIIGMIYNVCYPGELSKLIKIDPINLFGIEPEEFPRWYHKYFAEFFKDYDKYNLTKEKASKLKWKEGIASIRQNRPLLSEAQAAAVLERISEPAGDGLIRYTFDRRNKKVHGIPYSAEHIKKIFTAVPNPILIIVCEESLRKKLFRNTAFLLDKSVYPNGNMRCVSVKGGHDVHISNPERLAPFIKEFFAKGVEGIDGKSKL